MNPFAAPSPRTIQFRSDAERHALASAIGDAARKGRKSDGGRLANRLRLGGSVSGTDLDLRATPRELHPFVMEITGAIADTSPAGSIVEARVAVPVSGGALFVGIAFGVLIVFFGGQSLAIGFLLAAAIWFPLWLAVVRMNQRRLLERTTEIETLLRQIAGNALTPSISGPHVTFANAD